VKGRNRVNTQWAQIDVQLTRRADLIPNLVETVKGYASHEKETFEKIAVARNELKRAQSPAEAMMANDLLSDQLGRLLAVTEAYPALKADRGFVEMQTWLKDTEEQIAYARQFYNDTVLLYNNNIHQFPSNIVANMFNFRDESYYMAKVEKTADVKVSF